ncbi:MAG: sulfatase family protein [Planctomycetota bacterium]
MTRLAPAVFCLLVAPPVAVAEEKPNIILIMADDLGYGDVKCYNAQSKINTPNIDRLASEGVRFTDAHSPSAVCTPTRYGLLTGRYCWRTWMKSRVIEGDGSTLIEPGQCTVASMLKQQGYRTACIGKWHLGVGWTYLPGQEPPRDRKWRTLNGQRIDYVKPLNFGPTDLGFDYFFGTPGCATDDPLVFFIENKTVLGNPKRQRGKIVADRWRHEDVDTTFTRKAIQFIDEHQENAPQRPFFLYLALSVPHAPWLPPEFVKGKSRAGPRGDQVVLADWIVGKIVETLDKHDLAGDTLLVFTSDNGPRIGVNGHQSSGALRGYKSHAWEGGHRVPLIARWPGKIEPGVTSDEVICLVDVLRTCAAIVGAELPQDAGPDSHNVLPALLGEALDRPIREATVLHSCWGAFVVRQGPWKLILGTPGSGGWVAPRDKDPVEGAPGQLYNLADDPAEERNLWDEKPDEVKRLAALLDKYKLQGHSQPDR